MQKKLNVICLPTKHLGAWKLVKMCSCGPDLIGIWKCWFLRRGENWSTWRKTSWSKDENQNKLNPHMAPGPGVEPGPHWWEVSTLTTAPSLLPLYYVLSTARNEAIKSWDNSLFWLSIMCRMKTRPVSHGITAAFGSALHTKQQHC